MRLLLAGGSGQIGQLLARAFTHEGHTVVALGRSSGGVLWDAATLGPWCRELERCDVLINLAGRSVNCRYTAHNRSEILRSRVDSTRVLGEAIAQVAHPPRVWLQASTATIYAHRYDAPNDERSGLLGGSETGVPASWHFGSEVGQAWERALDRAPTPRTRKLALRLGMVMSPDRGGIFEVLLGLVRRGLGGRWGDGRQYLSWLHHADLVRALRWLIEHEEVRGAVNLSAPEPLPQAQFMRELRLAWGARVGLPATKWMLELGALCMRTETELVLKSRRVVPGRLLEAGFVFEQPSWSGAAHELCESWRSARGAPA
ncbi:MAG: TIGR01777 family protein [Planctomycetes bacterium]|nr:TIGR01777 family protein [Planctomycetota bacterium]